MCALEDKDVLCVEEKHPLAAGMKHLKDNATFLLLLPHSFTLFLSLPCFIQTTLVSLLLLLGSSCLCVCVCERACGGVSFVVWVLSERVSAQGNGSPWGAKLSHGSTQPAGATAILPSGCVYVCVCAIVCWEGEFPIWLMMLKWVHLPLYASVYACAFICTCVHVCACISVGFNVYICLSVCAYLGVYFCLCLSSASVCQAIAKARFSPRVTLTFCIAPLSVFMTTSHTNLHA